MSKPAKTFRESLALLIRARFPILYVESFEEARVLDEVRAVAKEEALVRTTRPVHVWSATRGFVGPDGKAESGTSDVKRAVEWLSRQDQPGVYVMLDLHAHLGSDHQPADPMLVRLLRDLSAAFQSGVSARTLVAVAPLLRIPPELEKDVTLVNFPLPGESEIRGVLDQMIAANTRLQVEVDALGRERLAKAALGLTLHEATNAFARAMVHDGTLTNEDIHIVTEEKKQAVRKTGLLEFTTVDLSLADVGGLENLKRWLAKRADSWLDDAAAYGLPAPKGVLMTGVPGCGKSLTAKAIAAAWELPLLRLDVGKVFAGLVGASEQNMRTAIRTAEATAPCVLWIDEIEKGFSGLSGSGDSGITSRVFGSFLTWMQEKTAPVFVIATANNVTALPPEFLRKGRFDEIFFVDLPTLAERRDIWQLHLAKRLTNSKAGGQIEASAQLADRLAGASEGYSGAEIEQAVIAGLFDAYAERRSLTEEDLFRALQNMVPLSVTQSEQIASIRGWATTRAVAATATEDRSGYKTALATSSADPSPPDGSDRTDDLSRGGRLVEF